MEQSEKAALIPQKFGWLYQQYIHSARENLIEIITGIIAVNYPFTIEEIYRAYLAYQSFDLIIEGCNYASEMGIGDLEAAIDQVRKRQ